MASDYNEAPLIIRGDTIRKHNGDIELLAMRRIVMMMKVKQSLQPTVKGLYPDRSVPYDPPPPRGDFAGDSTLSSWLQYIDAAEIGLFDSKWVLQSVTPTVDPAGNLLTKFSNLERIRHHLLKLEVIVGSVDDTLIQTNDGSFSYKPDRWTLDDDSNDDYLHSLGEIAKRLHNLYEKKGTALVRHLNDKPNFATGIVNLFTTGSGARYGTLKDKWDLKHESLASDIQQIAMWTYDLLKEVESFSDERLFVVGELIKTSGYEVKKQGNGDLRVNVKSPRKFLVEYFKAIHDKKITFSDWSEAWMESFLEVATEQAPEYKYIWAEALGRHNTPETLSALFGLTLKRQILFLTDRFTITEEQVRILAYCVDKAHEASARGGPSYFVSLNAGDKVKLVKKDGAPNEAAHVTVKKTDLDAIYKVIYEMSGKNTTLGKKDPKNGWVLGFDDFSKKWDAHIMEHLVAFNWNDNRKRDYRFGSNWDLGAIIPGMVEFTALPDPNRYVSYHYGEGKSHWYLSNELPCGDRGWIWYDLNIRAYVFAWKLKKPNGDLDLDKMDHWMGKNSDGTWYIKPMGQLQHLWKIPPQDRPDTSGSRTVMKTREMRKGYDGLMSWSHRTAD